MRERVRTERPYREKSAAERTLAEDVGKMAPERRTEPAGKPVRLRQVSPVIATGY